MHTNTFADLVLYFAIYSTIGWICEVIYCSVPAKKLVKRGFLAGPYCPIYGFGAIALISMLYPLAQKFMSIPLLFIASVIITSALEYFTSWLMEKMFNMRWWDYSNHRFNINGRVCLLNSVLFGIMGIVLLYLVQPVTDSLISAIPLHIRMVLASLFIAILLADLITTLNGAYKLDAKLKEIQSTLQTLREYDERFSWYDKSDTQTSLLRLESHAKECDDANILLLVEKLQALLNKDNSGRRLLSSFTKVKSHNLQENVEIVKQSFTEKKFKLTTHAKAYFEKHKIKPSEDEKEKSFATGINFYKLFWVFFIACFIGYVVEILFCFVTRGYVESRQGMIYGPFNQVYGFGAVLMVIVLHKLKEKGDRWVFVGSALIGGVFEAICSFIQEICFGSLSWDYTGHPFSFFGGRTSLLYMFFWGILGTVFIKEIYPRLSRFIERIPNKHGVVLSWILVVFMSLNMTVSGLAVHRWSQRVQMIEPKNQIDIFLDERYPDEYLEIIYPNMSFIK